MRCRSPRGNADFSSTARLAPAVDMPTCTAATLLTDGCEHCDELVEQYVRRAGTGTHYEPVADWNRFVRWLALALTEAAASSAHGTGFTIGVCDLSPVEVAACEKQLAWRRFEQLHATSIEMLVQLTPDCDLRLLGHPVVLTSTFRTAATAERQSPDCAVCYPSRGRSQLRLLTSAQAGWLQRVQQSDPRAVRDWCQSLAPGQQREWIATVGELTTAGLLALFP